MKVRITLIAGLLIAFLPLLQAETPTKTANHDHPSTVTVSYRNIYLTNSIGSLENRYPVLTKSVTNGVSPISTMENDTMTSSNEYPVIAIYRSQAGFDVTATDGKVISSTAITNRSLLSSLYASELLGSKYGPTNTNNTTAGGGLTRKKPAQTLVIEPLSSRKDFTSDRIRIQAYSFGTPHQPTAWHEWVKPRLFMTKWADYWANGTDATPVALTVIKF